MATQEVIRQRNIGLKDLYIAEVTENTEVNYATATPVKFARAINAKITEKFNSEPIYSDDSVEEVLESFEGGEIELEVNKLAPADIKALYDTIYKDGYLLKSGSDQAKEVAVGFRSKKMDGKYDFVWLYACKFIERPSFEYNSKGEKVETKTNSIKGIFYDRAKENTIDGKNKNLYEIVVDESNLVVADTTAKEAIADWFAKVQEYTAPTVTP